MPQMLHMIRYLSAMARLAEDRRGVTAIVTAIALTVVVGAAGLAVDVAYWLNSTRGLQAAADQAAYSAASASGTSGCSSTTAVPQALAITAARGYAKGATPTTDGDTTTAADGTSTVKVQCTTSNSHFTVTIDQVQPMWFARLFRDTAPTASASATAQLAGKPSNLCILALDGTNVSEGVTGSDASAFWLQGATNTTVHCGVAVDSTNINGLSTGGGASLTATDLYLAGGGNGSTTAPLPGPGSSTINVATDHILTNQLAVQDPYAGRAIPSYSCGSYSVTQLNSGTLDPAVKSVYCGGLSLGGSAPSSVTVKPGVYIIAGGSLTFNSKVTVTDAGLGGVTFVLTGDSTHGYATLTISGGPQSNVSLSAPTSGPYGGLTFFQDRSAPAPSTSGGSTACGSGTGGQNQITGGSNQLITGALYFPNQSLCYSGGSSSTGAGKCTQLIAHTLSFTGNSDIQSICAGTGVSSFTLLTPQLIR
jgi:Flp pilus assembly protein TadG